MPLQLPLHDARIGAGRGRGRGKFSNLPAWMTQKGGDNLGSTVNGMPLQPAPSGVSTNPTTASASQIDNDELRNILLASNALPAVARDASTGEAVNRYRPRSSGVHITPQHNHGHQMPAVNGRQNPRDESVIRPRGRGRGREQTKPAWMTRDQKP
jgi:hypothetical protein